jgi:hypothetical protein
VVSICTKRVQRCKRDALALLKEGNYQQLIQVQPILPAACSIFLIESIVQEVVCLQDLDNESSRVVALDDSMFSLSRSA